jgi:N,N-dimethylformamidase
MIPLVGYAHTLSARPGETIRFSVSNATGEAVSAKIVRVISADANPAGPGIKVENVTASTPQQIATPKAETTQRGSYAVVDLGERLTTLESFALTATIWPTKLGDTQQPIISWLDPANGAGVSFEIGVDRKLTAVVGHGQGPTSRVDGGPVVIERVWQDVTCLFDATTKKLSISLTPHGHGKTLAREMTLPATIEKPRGTKLCIGASPLASFDGKIEHPKIYMAADTGTKAPLFHWDFAQAMDTDRIVDTGSLKCDGALINSPARAMTGSNWTGREMCFRHAPDQYAAIHFHSDDLDDCRWPITHEWTIPAGLKSGAYALMLSAGSSEENIPFYVVPPKGKQTAKIAVLASTFTYTIYHNHARPEWQRDAAWKDAWIKQSAEWTGAYPHNPGQHPEYGWSTYNFHTDGSGIHTASWLRPMLNVRIGYITYPYPDIRASGLRHYPADSHLMSWLEAKGYDFDVITDWELHSEGYDLLKGYATIVTGSHPEYHTGEMLDALETYRDNGGRLMYLGGNGFYWKVALNKARPGQIEIRRAEGGIRAWAAEPGEYYNQFDGEYGGLWRRNARPPQKLVGVGFTAQGNFVGSHYRITDVGRNDPRTSWIFAGVKDATVGGFGLSGHGAAGFELDRVDYRLGTPRHALVVAASEDHPPDAPWVLVPEEQLTHIVTWSGEPAPQLIRADMTFFETPSNGAVFSTGSITFCGSLPSNGYDNNISRLMQNVLDRFSDPNAQFPLASS